MQEKDTNELEKVLGKTHLSDYDSYVQKNKDSMLSDSNSFSTYVKEKMSEKGITQQTVFLKADVPERYGYKLLSGEKHTKQRDVILRICYAADFTLQETQRALKKYGMAELYAKDERDALVMIAFNEKPGSIIEVNTMLKEHGLAPLRTSGVQD
ncbi:hypothetical protein SAMN04487770_13634 [Butyrivibrio sp. ob235]|uniref:hypothetical protein n=1 Tax=Butyrivibrio sp. ob235 TaxID=1761780 RepID=UPI0008C9E39E|nr:hypothetical protein [Butyrivibrio sp. ob235]SEM38855.1 hypothetical protein SAMN04487770_13634 [Butyrivibrio sp. ob235]